MPDFNIRWTNRGPDTQDWQVRHGSRIDDFTLPPNFSRSVNVRLARDFTFQIAVSTENRFAAANLSYNAATRRWSLSSNTPNEFDLEVQGQTVRVTCFLANGAVEGDESITYEPQEPGEEPA